MAVLLIWAVMMVWFFASGRITHYLIGEGTFRIQVLIGGMLLAVLGFFNWQMRSVPEDDCGHDHGLRNDFGEGDCCETGAASGHDHYHDHHHAHSHGQEKELGHTHGPDCGHDHGGESSGGHSHEGTAMGRGFALALLALSVTTAVAFTPDDFSDAYKRNMLNAHASRPDKNLVAPDAFRLTPENSPTEAAAGGMTLAVVEKYRPRNQDGNFELGVEELYYSSADPEYAKVMSGQGVETIGQVVKDNNSKEPGHWRVFVLQMSCCAADARPVSLPVVFEGPVPPIQEMGWFKLTGKLEYTEERGIPVARLRATAAQPSLRPKEQRTLY